MNVHTTADEQLISRVVAAVLVELGHVERAGAPANEPEYLPDAQVRARFFGCSRQTYWALTKRDDFPEAYQPGGPGSAKLRKVSEVRAWLASHAVA